MLVEGLSAIDGVRLFVSAARLETGVISFRIDRVDVALTGALLDALYGIVVARDCIRAGGASRERYVPEGIVRVSLGPFNGEADVAALVSAVHDIAARFGTERGSGSNA